MTEFMRETLRKEKLVKSGNIRFGFNAGKKSQANKSKAQEKNCALQKRRISMRNVLATELVKDEKTAQKELAQIIKGMVITRLLKRTYEIEQLLLLYVPFALMEFKVENTGKTKKAKRMQHIYVSMELATARMKAFTELAVFDPQEICLKEEQVAFQQPNMEHIAEAARKELLFKILPKNLKAWRNYEINMKSCSIVYRPLWLMRYRMFGGKMRIYKTFGDCFNL